MHLDGWLCHLQRIVRGGRRLRLRLSGPALSRLCSGVGDPWVRWRQEMVKMRHVAEIPDIGFAAPVGLPRDITTRSLSLTRPSARPAVSCYPAISRMLMTTVTRAVATWIPYPADLGPLLRSTIRASLTGMSVAVSMN